MNNWVRVPGDRGQAALAWAKQHCATYITNDAEVEHRGGVFTEYYYRFYFTDSEQGRQDMTAFALKWS